MTSLWWVPVIMVVTLVILAIIGEDIARAIDRMDDWRGE